MEDALIVEPVAVFSTVAAIVALSVLLAKTTWGKHISPAPFIVIISVLASNVLLLPFNSPAYDVVTGNFLLAALPILLIHANLRTIAKVTGPVLLAFGVGLFASACGIALASLIISLGPFSDIIPPLYSAVVSGGMVNLLAVGEAIEVFDSHPELLPALIAGSVPLDIVMIVLAGQMGAVGFIAKLFRRGGVGEPDALPKGMGSAEDNAQIDVAHDEQKARPLLEDLALSVAVGFLLGAGGVAVAGLTDTASFAVVYASTFALILANVAPKFCKSLHLSQPLGIWLLFVFLSALTVQSELSSLGNLTLTVFGFVLILYLVHLTVHYGLCARLGVPLPAAVAGSLAGLFGPSVTVAIAGAKGWQSVIVPGMVCALIGTSIGTYVGLALFAFLN